MTPPDTTSLGPQSTSALRAWLPRLAAVVLSLLVSLIAVDVLVRVTGRDVPLVWRPDARLGWWHIPSSSMHFTSEGNGWVQINALGIRDRERTLAKPPGTFRIAIFGDSMTEGTQVNLDQTFCQLLEGELTRQLQRPVEVLNFGVNGYGPLQEYLLYREHGRAFEPDLIIHAVFLDNDVADLHPELASGQRGAPFLRDFTSATLDIDYSAAEESARSYGQQPLATIRRASALYRLVSELRYRRRSQTDAAASRVAGGGVPRRYLLYAEDAPPAWDVAWARLDQVVTAFSDEARRAGATYALLSVPAGQIVNEEAWNALHDEFPAFGQRAWDRFSAEKRFAALAQSKHVPLLAPLQVFVNHPKRLELFFGRAGHLTPEGHRTLTGVLAREMHRLSLLPAR